MNKQLLEYLKDVEDDKEKITTIRLNYKKLGPIETQYIAQALLSNTHVTTITLESNKLGDRGAQILAAALKSNSCVTELNLAANGIHDDGLIALADLVRSSHTLESLKLNHNNSGVRGASALADALKVSKSLKKLNISRSLPPEGFIAMVKSLTRNVSLLSLNMAGVPGGTAGAVALGESLKYNTTLRLLNLTDCALEKEAIASIISGIKENPNIELHNLILKDNPLSSEIIDKMDKLLTLIHERKKKNQPNMLRASAIATTTTTNTTITYVSLRQSQGTTDTTLPAVNKPQDLRIVSPGRKEQKTVKTLAPSESKEKTKFKLPFPSSLRRSQGEELTSPTDQHRTPPSLESWVLEDVDEFNVHL